MKHIELEKELKARIRKRRIIEAILGVFTIVSSLVLIRWALYRVPPKDTNLEFWIAENVDKVDFSNYQEKFGLMGGREYYGTGYLPSTNENGEQIDPEACVVYTVTSYPDHISNKKYITRITITDPLSPYMDLHLIRLQMR